MLNKGYSDTLPSIPTSYYVSKIYHPQDVMPCTCIVCEHTGYWRRLIKRLGKFVAPELRILPKLDLYILAPVTLLLKGVSSFLKCTGLPAI